MSVIIEIAAKIYQERCREFATLLCYIAKILISLPQKHILKKHMNETNHLSSPKVKYKQTGILLSVSVSSNCTQIQNST